MRAKARKWGNSLAVRIPKGIAELAGLCEEDDLDIRVVDAVIYLRQRRRAPSLSELLIGITADNIHGESDFGQRKGREAW